MLAMIRIEAIGDNSDQEVRFYYNLTNCLIPGLGDATFGKPTAAYFVAEITGIDPKYKFKRNFIRGKKDYSKSNRKGSRGVFIYYFLESGKIYDVKRPVSWKNTERFYCAVSEAGDIINLTEQEVLECIKNI